jgi:hypothetical protein
MIPIDWEKQSDPFIPQNESGVDGIGVLQSKHHPRGFFAVQ